MPTLIPDNVIAIMGFREEPEYESIMYEHDGKCYELATAIKLLYKQEPKNIKRIVYLTDRLRRIEKVNKDLYQNFLRAQKQKEISK